MNIHATD